MRVYLERDRQGILPAIIPTLLHYIKQGRKSLQVFMAKEAAAGFWFKV